MKWAERAVRIGERLTSYEIRLNDSRNRSRERNRFIGPFVSKIKDNIGRVRRSPVEDTSLPGLTWIYSISNASVVAFSLRGR